MGDDRTAHYPDPATAPSSATDIAKIKFTSGHHLSTAIGAHSDGLEGPYRVVWTTHRRRVRRHEPEPLRSLKTKVRPMPGASTVPVTPKPNPWQAPNKQGQCYGSCYRPWDGMQHPPVGLMTFLWLTAWTETVGGTMFVTQAAAQDVEIM